MPSFLKRHKLFACSLLGVLALALLLGLWLGYRSIGPYRSYRADMMKPAPGQALELLWGAKSDRREAVIRINGREHQMRCKWAWPGATSRH